MSTVVWDVTMSLDGFTSGPNVRAEEPMGDGGEDLHAWMGATGPDAKTDAAAFDEASAGIGAIIIGRRTFDLGLKNWGGTPWPGIPSFVVTHRPREDFRGDNGGMFAFDGLEGAARRAKAAAGDKQVRVMGATMARQLLKAGLIDEISLHISPILLGGGVPMFDGEQTRLVATRMTAGSAAHLYFRVVNS